MIPPAAQHRLTPAPTAPRDDRRRAGVLLLLAMLLAAIAMAPTVTGDFVAWDDPQTIAHPDPPSLANLRRYWTAPQAGLYVPLTYTAWATVAGASRTPLPGDFGAGLDPMPFHLLNVLIHLFGVAVVFWLVRRLAGSAPAGFAAAVVFGTHPVQVEAVAWASGTKDLMAGVFGMGTIAAYLLAGDEALASGVRRAWFAASLLAFAAALLSKPAAAAVPVLLVCIECWRRTRWRLIVRRIWPYVAMALPTVVMARAVQPAPLAAAASPLYARPLIAADAVIFYLRHLVDPAGLAIVYGRTPRAVLSAPWYALLWPPVVVVAFAAAVWAWRRRLPLVALGAAVFVAGLLPALGLLPFDFQQWSTVADHYLYLPMLGVGLGLAEFARRVSPRFAVAGAVGLGAVLAPLSMRQARTWSDSRALFTRAVAITPRDPTLRKLLASDLLATGDYTGAIAQCRAGLATDPAGAGLYDVLGSALRRAGDHSAAAAAYRQAIRCRPDYIPAHQDLSALLAEDGDQSAAASESETARRLLASPAPR